MMTMLVVSYIVTWVNIIYSLIAAPTDVELRGKEME